MECPNCLKEVHVTSQNIYLGDDTDGSWWIEKRACPNEKCKKYWLYLCNGRIEYIKGKQTLPPVGTSSFNIIRVKTPRLILPKGINRKPVSCDVPKKFSEDYYEACLVLSDSPKASAALSRRCLQNLLRDQGNFKDKDLATEIQNAIDSNTLPSHISENLDSVRNIGNFAAHPIKSKSSGEVVNVEPHEAEWNLEVIESLFDFYFVQPEISKRKKDLLNKKLGDAGKAPLK